METSSDPPHFSASLPLGKQQRPAASPWKNNIYLEKRVSAHEKARTFRPNPPKLGLRVIWPQSGGYEVITAKLLMLADALLLFGGLYGSAGTSEHLCATVAVRRISLSCWSAQLRHDVSLHLTS